MIAGKRSNSVAESLQKHNFSYILCCVEQGTAVDWQLVGEFRSKFKVVAFNKS